MIVPVVNIPISEARGAPIREHRPRVVIQVDGAEQIEPELTHALPVGIRFTEGCAQMCSSGT